jgi:hypothetical protein
MNLTAIFAARLISSIGSVLTAASIPLFLFESDRVSEVPTNAIAMSLGILIGTKYLVPNIHNISTKKILLASSSVGFISFLILSLLFFSEFGNIIHSQSIFIGMTLFAALLRTIDDSTAQATIGELRESPRLIHVDSALHTISRTVGPGLAAALLLVFHNKFQWILAIDALSYGIAVLLYAFFLKGTVGNPAAAKSNSPRESYLDIFRGRMSDWTLLIFCAVAAAAYNVGVVVHLKAVGFSMEQVSFFYIIQNMSMVFTSISLAKWQISFQKIRIKSIVTAAVGMLLIGLGNGMLTCSIGTAVMAVGMVLFLQTLRAKIATDKTQESRKRMNLAFMATVNSLATVSAGLMYNGLSGLLPWKGIFLIAGSVYIAGIVVIRLLERYSRAQ